MLPVSIPSAAILAATAAPNQISGSSPVRDGVKLVSIGLQADGPLVVAATGIGSGVFQFNEPGRLGRLFITASATPYQVTCPDISINNDKLTSGFPSVNQFAPDATHSPKFGHYVDNNTRLTIQLNNADAAAISCGIGFSCVGLWDGLEAAARKVGAANTIRRAVTGR
jgi:hypothetical protein